MRFLSFLFIFFVLCNCKVLAQSMYMSQQRTSEKDKFENLNGACGILVLSEQNNLAITVTNAHNAKITNKGKTSDGYYEYTVIVPKNETRNPKIEINKRGDVDKIDFVAKVKPNFYAAYLIKEVAKPIRMENQTKANDIITDASLAQVEINSPILDLQFICPKGIDAEIKSTQKANDQSITITTITFRIQPLLDAKAAVERETEALSLIDDEIRQEFINPKLNDDQRKQLSARRDKQSDLLNSAEEKWNDLNHIIVYADGTNQLVIDISEATPRRKFCWGILLREGKVVEKGIELLQAGDPTTMLTQAKSYEQGTGAYAKDIIQALFWFEKAADAGNIEAQEHLADVLFNGSNGYTPDYAKAFKWNTICANRNHLAAMRSLATLYEKGQGCQINKKEAIKWLLKYNKSTSDAEAQLQLALLYGIDNDEGISWLKRAADNGNAEAMARYAAYIINTDTAIGEIYYKRSVEKGYAQGKYEWGKIIAKGSYGITKNSIRARILFKEAAQSGIKEAEYELSSLDLSMSNDSTIANLSAQIPELHERAKNGDANAMYMLYFLYKHKKDNVMASRMAFSVLYNHMNGNDWIGEIYKKDYGNYYGVKAPDYLRKAFNLTGVDMSIYQIFHSGKDVFHYQHGIPHIIKYFINGDIGKDEGPSNVNSALITAARFNIKLSKSIREQIPAYLKNHKSSYFKEERKGIKEYIKGYDWLFIDNAEEDWVKEYIKEGYLNKDNKTRRLAYSFNKTEDHLSSIYTLRNKIPALEKAVSNYDGDALVYLYLAYKILSRYYPEYANKTPIIRAALIHNIGLARTGNHTIFSDTLDIELLKKAGIYEDRKQCIIKFEKRIKKGTDKYYHWLYTGPIIGERNRNYEFIFEDLFTFYGGKTIISYSSEQDSLHGTVYKKPITKNSMLSFINFSLINHKLPAGSQQYLWKKPEELKKAHDIAKSRIDKQRAANKTK